MSEEAGIFSSTGPFSTGPDFVVLALGTYFNKEALDVHKSQSPGDYEPTNFYRVVDAIKSNGELKTKGFTARRFKGVTLSVSPNDAPSKRLNAALTMCRLLWLDWGVPLSDLGIDDDFVAVPVPSNDAILGVDPVPRWGPRELARTLFPDRTRDWVRFRSRIRRASEGGSRSRSSLLDAMEYTGPRNSGATAAVIIDDVMTTGNHILAVADLLQRQGIQRFTAVVVGATESTVGRDPWAPRRIRLSAWGRVDVDR